MSELEFWKDLGNIFDAVLDYQKKNVEFNNRFINPWIRLGNIFDRQDQTNDAVHAYQRAAEIDPNTAQSWVDLGDAQFKNGAFDEAVGAYRKAVTLDPEAGWPLGNLALSLVTQGKIEEAIPLYKKSIDLLIEVKDKAICWNRLGNAYRKLNDYENAFLAFQKADLLDGENTGFSDKLDESLPNTSVVAPEEILEQMIVEQALEESEAELATPEAVAEAAQEIIQPETESAIVSTPEMETAAELIAFAPNVELKSEESVEETAQQLDEIVVEEPVNEIALAEEETSQTNFDIIQVVEDVIAKVEQAYIEQENSEAGEVQAVEEISAETELAVVSEETAQDIEAIAETNEEAVAEVGMPVISEETVLEVESIAEAELDEETVLEVDAVMESEDAVLEVESIAETELDEEALVESEDAILEIESVAGVVEDILEIDTPVMNEEVLLEVEAPAISEETTEEIKSVVAEINEEAPIANEVSEEEQTSKGVLHRIPAWLMTKGILKARVEEAVAEAEMQQELTQVDSVTTLSDISQEATVSESVVNMDVVETYTDPLTAQLTTEPSLSEETLPAAIDQAQGYALIELKDEAESEAQEMIAVDESAAAEESSIAMDEEQTTELAYKEYLKDMAEPVNTLTDHVDEMQSEAPITKVSKNGEVRIVMDTKNAHVWNELGNIYLNASACDDAIASYSKAIELDRHFAWPYSNLALAYVQKGRFAEAILLYQRGIELFISDKDKAITWNRLGNVYRRINDYSNAIAAYQTADGLDPENATLSLRSSFGLLGNMYSDSKPAYVG